MDKLSARPPRAGARLAAALALLAGVAGLAACGPAAPAARPSGVPPSAPATSAPAAASPPASATAAPVPAGTAQPGGFQVQSMSFVSDQAGFALGTVSCGSQRCGALLATTDGGARWAPLTSPASSVVNVDDDCPAGRACVAQIRFATPLIGYAYGPGLYLTTDGGHHWRQAGEDVGSLETADGTVVRVASDYPGCGGAREEVEAAPAASTAWRPLPAPPIPTICPPVLYRQGQQLVLAGYGNPAGGVAATAIIARSSDGGQAWTAAAPDSCYSHQGYGRDGYASAVALAPPDALVLLCQHQMPAADGSYDPSWVRVSADGGASYGPDQAVPLLARAPGEVASYQLAAASAGRLLAVEDTIGGGTPGSQVLLTENGGVSWSTVLRLPPGPPVVLVGYEDPLTGRVAQGAMVWTTRDGGRTWRGDRF
jgi:photosystem II stability/assembly factor-like uncharacterized protein